MSNEPLAQVCQLLDNSVGHIFQSYQIPSTSLHYSVILFEMKQLYD